MKFNESVGLEANIELLMASLESSDPELATILRDNLALLKGTVDSSTRQDARSRFNSAVLTALDGLSEEN